MRGKYFIDFMGSFAHGNPDIVDGWKHTIQECEAENSQVAAFKLPENEAPELIILIEKVLRDKIGTIKPKENHDSSYYDRR
jgi:hypothetical protein